MGSSISKAVESVGNPEWKHMPWRRFKSVSEQAKVMPTFVVIEWMYRFAAWNGLAHALKTGTPHVWFSSWMCGTANDIFFMFMPFCDNFWQAQACVMITPRLPLYIVELYATVLYYSTTAARQFGLPLLSEAALTGLLAHFIYHPYDVLGPPNLWWTWHDGDPCISERHYNAPYGSSIWILTYISLHQLLLRFCELSPEQLGLSSTLQSLLKTALQYLPNGAADLAQRFDVWSKLSGVDDLQRFLNQSSWLTKILSCGLVCTPLFMSLMGVFQIIAIDKLGVPGLRTYRAVIVTYALLVAHGFYQGAQAGTLSFDLKTATSTVTANKSLLMVLGLFYATLIWIAKQKNSDKHVSTGCHQKFGSSKVVKDIMGYDREDHLSGSKPAGYSKHDYEFPSQKENGKPDAAGNKIICPEKEGLHSEWYTVKGVPRQNHAGDLKRVILFSVMGMSAFTLAFTNVLRAGK